MKKRFVVTCVIIAATVIVVLVGYRFYLHRRIESEIARLKIGGQERAEAVYALGKLGRAAVPRLAELLSDEDREVRDAAADALGDIGPPAKSAVPAIVEMLKEREQIGRAAFEREGYHIAPLGRIGPDAEAAVSFLSELLDRQNSSIRVYAAEALWKINRHPRAIPTLVEVMQGIGGRRMEASSVLEAIGPDAKAAVPALIEALTDDSISGYADRALSATGPSPHEIPAILQALAKVHTPSRRDGIIVVLDKIGVEPEELVRRHVEAINEKDLGGSIWATGFMIKAGPDDVAAVPALTQALGDENADVRAWAASTLIKIGPVAKQAIPALVEAENDTEEQVRSAAVMALDVIRREPSPTERPRPAIDAQSRISPRIVLWIALATVVVGIMFVYGFSLSRRRPRFRMKRIDLVLLSLILIVGVPSFYLWHLATIREFPFSLGPAPFLLKYGTPAVRHATLRRFEAPVSLDVWVFRDSTSKYCAISTLISKVNLHPSGKWLDKTILAILIEALRDENGGVREIAAEALGRFGPEANEAIPALTVAFQDWSACEAAAAALPKMGPAAMAAVPVLRGVNTGRSRLAVAETFLALREIESSRDLQEFAVSTLVEALKDNGRLVSRDAARALGKIGPEAQSAVPALREATADADKLTAAEAFLALNNIESTDEHLEFAVVTLIEVLKEEDASVRKEATEALERLGPAAKTAAPALLDVIKTWYRPKDSEVQNLDWEQQEQQKEFIRAAEKAFEKIRPRGQREPFVAAGPLVEDGRVYHVLTLDMEAPYDTPGSLQFEYEAIYVVPADVDLKNEAERDAAARRISPIGMCCCPAWSRNGTKVAYLDFIEGFYQGKIIIIDVTTGEQETFSGINATSDAIAWSEDGRSIAFYNAQREICVLDTKTKSVKNIAHVVVAQETGLPPAEGISMSPDGKWICFMTREGGGEDGWMLDVLDTETGALKKVGQTDDRFGVIWPFRWTRDSTHVVFRGFALNDNDVRDYGTYQCEAATGHIAPYRGDDEQAYHQDRRFW